MSENTTTPTIDSIEETNTPEQKYVCFVKRRPGGKFIPYTEPGNSDKIVAGTLRRFLDHQINEWYKAGEKEQPENRPLLKVSLDDFAADIHANGMNAKLVSILGWNYPQAIRMAESEGTIFLLTIHPRFQSIPFSFRQTCDDTDYALHLVEQLLSLRGGRIAFEEHDPEKHSGTCEFSGTSAIRSRYNQQRYLDYLSGYRLMSLNMISPESDKFEAEAELASWDSLTDIERREFCEECKEEA